MTRRHIAVPTPYTNQLAYSRIVVDGDDAWISGCAPLDADGRLVGGQSAYHQARQCIENVADALALADMRLSDLVRIRIYLRSFADLEEVCRAERETLSEIRPAATVIAVQDLVAKDMLVYMDADARRAR
ncbi:MAG: Rid family hydrolase [Caulobacter sp.]